MALGTSLTMATQASNGPTTRPISSTPVVRAPAAQPPAGWATTDWARNQQVWGNSPYYSSVSIGPYIGTGNFNQVPAPVGGQNAGLAVRGTSGPGPVPSAPVPPPLPGSQASNYGAPTGSGFSYQSIWDLFDTMANQQRAAAQRAVDLAANQANMTSSLLDSKFRDRSQEIALQKQKKDVDIYAAQRQMGREGEARQIAMQHGADYITNQTTQTNSQLGDLNLLASGEARAIAYQNALLNLAFQQLGIDRDQYVAAQNYINSQQQKLNTMTNLGSEQNTSEFGAKKRNTYDDSVARGALTSGGAQANLNDVDVQFRIAQDVLRENLRAGTEENKFEREKAGNTYRSAELGYGRAQATANEESAKHKDQIKLLESQGERLRSTYGYNVSEAQRDMQRADLTYRTNMDTLATNIQQWGIDKQIWDTQLNQAFKQLGIDKQMAQMDYLQKAGALPDELNAIYQNTILQAAQYMPLVEQNPWLMQVIGKSMTGTTPLPSYSPNGSATGSLRARGLN